MHSFFLLPALAAASPQDQPIQPAAVATAPSLEHGPFRGACDGDRAELWARATAPGIYVLEARDSDGQLRVAAADEASARDDLTLHWAVAGLRERSWRGWRVTCAGVEVWRDDGFVVAAAVRDAEPRAVVAFGSCANEKKQKDQTVWSAITAHGPAALVLLGDTPYIDSKKLEGHRRRYRAFFDCEPIAACLRTVATYNTWDDHDYVANDKFGAVDGRDAARRAFVENHAQHGYGTGTDGIFQSFRRGPVEVFVLDTRWFADSEPCPFAPEQKSLLGRAQLEWLQRGLLASTAPFKVLACGMAWNGAVRSGKDDSWGRWWHERDGLLRWAGAQRIGGLVLVGGDLHVVRLIRHATTDLCGYDVPECVSSPLAQSSIGDNAGAIDGLVFEALVESAFLLVEGDAVGEPRVVLRFVDGDGRDLHATTIALGELQAKGTQR